MAGKVFSPEFVYNQNRDKTGKNNPMFGLKKSSATITKLTKLVYVYTADDMTYIGSYSTVECLKTFKLSSDTLYKYIWIDNKGNSYKGKIFSRIKLHDI